MSARELGEAEVFDPTACALGEGALWHPERNQLFWFDIIRHRLLSRVGDKTRRWQFDEHVSAAGWIDANCLLIASETALFAFDLESGTAETVTPLEDDLPENRSNDGRADPFGGFWIGTMAKTGEHGQGAIYRYYRGELRQLYRGMTIPNAICFAPDGLVAFFADTRDRKVWRVSLDEAHGWPVGERKLFLDLEPELLNPDGAVIDADGRFWNAQWGDGRVAVYSPAGEIEGVVTIDALHTSCPAFGGPDLSTLYCTTARQGLSEERLNDGKRHGATFQLLSAGRGQPEHRVIL